MTQEASASSRPGPTVEAELLGSIGVILSALKSVSTGDLTQRVEVSYPDAHPVGALATSINFMVDALRTAREQSASELEQLQQRIGIIERQREAIRSLSVPIIELWSGILCVPVVGVLDSMRAADVTTTLLQTVVDKKAQHVIIDVTGVEIMDTQSADHFLRIARAVTLLGARCALSGMHPNIARTIVHMGVDLHGLRSYRSMREALKQALRGMRGAAARSETAKNAADNSLEKGR
jgi:rsbT co-antagonist protein RsbR